MNDTIVNYLSQYKDQYTKDVLVNKLKNDGYKNKEIEEAVALVYKNSDESQESEILSKKRGKFAMSFAMVKSCYRILRQDKELMLFPVLSGFTSIVTMIIFGVIIFFSGTFVVDVINNPEAIFQHDIVVYGILFAYYLLSYFIVSFFNAGLMACVMIRLEGGDPTFRDGIRAATNHIGSLFVWSLIAATVGVVLNLIVDKIASKFGAVGEVITNIVVGLIGIAWNLATLFVVPVIIAENVNPKESIKRSSKIFLKTWGENFIGNISMGLFFSIVILVPILLGGVLIFTLQTIPVFITVLIAIFVIMIAVSIVSSTMQMIFRTVLYVYATTGRVVEEFDVDIVTQAFAEKKKKKSFSLSS